MRISVTVQAVEGDKTPADLDKARRSRAQGGRRQREEGRLLRLGRRHRRGQHVAACEPRPAAAERGGTGRERQGGAEGEREEGQGRGEGMTPAIYKPDGNIVQRHPAEAAMPIATVLAALIAKLAGVEDTDTILYLALALAFIPAAVTWTGRADPWWTLRRDLGGHRCGAGRAGEPAERMGRVQAGRGGRDEPKDEARSDDHE